VTEETRLNALTLQRNSDNAGNTGACAIFLATVICGHSGLSSKSMSSRLSPAARLARNCNSDSGRSEVVATTARAPLQYSQRSNCSGMRPTVCAPPTSRTDCALLSAMSPRNKSVTWYFSGGVGAESRGRSSERASAEICRRASTSGNAAKNNRTRTPKREAGRATPPRQSCAAPPRDHPESACEPCGRESGRAAAPPRKTKLCPPACPARRRRVPQSR
jgi:hypothetical protein